MNMLRYRKYTGGWPKRVVDVPYDTWLCELMPGRNIHFLSRTIPPNTAWSSYSEIRIRTPKKRVRTLKKVRMSYVE